MWIDVGILLMGDEDVGYEQGLRHPYFVRISKHVKTVSFTCYSLPPRRFTHLRGVAGHCVVACKLCTYGRLCNKQRLSCRRPVVAEGPTTLAVVEWTSCFGRDGASWPRWCCYYLCHCVYILYTADTAARLENGPGVKVGGCRLYVEPCQVSNEACTFT
jgi:hypothetical protein